MDSILDDTKKILGLDKTYTPFDLDIVSHINSALSVANQIGVIPDPGFWIEDSSATWDEINIPANQLYLLKTYLYLRVRMLFDPPTMSFLIESMKNQLEEYEWRLNVLADKS